MAARTITPALADSVNRRVRMLKAVAERGGITLHAELEQLVNGGFTPTQALRAATSDAAEALGASDALGTIEPGKLADLVFLGSNPLADIRATRDVRRVMRGGRLYTVIHLVTRR